MTHGAPSRGSFVTLVGLPESSNSSPDFVRFVLGSPGVPQFFHGRDGEHV